MRKGPGVLGGLRLGAGSDLLARSRVGLEDAEYIAFGVLAVSEISLPRDRSLLLQDLAAGALDRVGARLPPVDGDGVDHRLLVVGAVHDRAVDPDVALVPGRREKVREGAAPVGELPAEGLLVEGRRALRVVRGDLKVADSS